MPVSSARRCARASGRVAGGAGGLTSWRDRDGACGATRHFPQSMRSNMFKLFNCEHLSKGAPSTISRARPLTLLGMAYTWRRKRSCDPAAPQKRITRLAVTRRFFAVVPQPRITTNDDFDRTSAQGGRMNPSYDALSSLHQWTAGGVAGSAATIYLRCPLEHICVR